MRHYTLLGTLGICALALLNSGCTKTSSCSRDEDLVVVSSSPEMLEGNTYHSAPFGGPYQYFPANRTVSFEHGLGVIPSTIQFWLAFSSDGDLAPSAGNMTELRTIKGDDQPALDATRISVRNNTCSDFYLWVVATRPSP